MNRQQILEAATQCVTKDRNATHGEPEDNFQAIADMQNAYLVAKIKQSGGSYAGPPLITATDVAALNVIQKLARTITTPKVADHWIDIAGYAACGGGIGEPIKKD